MQCNLVDHPILGFERILKLRIWEYYQGDQGQDRRTDQPGRKCHLGSEKRAISLRNSHPAGGKVV